MFRIDYNPASGPSGHQLQTRRRLGHRDPRPVPWCYARRIAPHVCYHGLMGTMRTKQLHEVLAPHEVFVLRAPPTSVIMMYPGSALCFQLSMSAFAVLY